MKKNIVYIIGNHFPVFFIVNLFFAFSGNCKTSISEIDELSDKKQYLTQMLDSLDLQKQNLKRNGLQIIEIEQQQAAIMDSLVALRNYIRKASEAPRTASSRTSGQKSFFSKPDNLFDWIIIIIGTIAIFSGLMLVIGIIHPMIFRYKYLRKKGPLQKSILNGPINLPPPSTAFPLYKRDKQITAEMPFADSLPDNNSGENLRHAINTSQKDPTSAANPSAPHSLRSSGATAPLPAEQKIPLVPPPALIEQQILAAFHDGLDIAAISRKFHLGSDHVALIVKIAGKNKS